MVDVNLFPEHNRIIIFENDRLFLNRQNCNYSLQISLLDQLCSKIELVSAKQQSVTKHIVGVYGIIQMQINKYLVIVTKSIIVGQIFNKKIYHVQELDFICLNKKQESVDQIYVTGLKSVLDNGSLYFSDQYDLTLSLQKFVQSKRGFNSARNQYMYNSEWVTHFSQAGLTQWCTPFISGYITINFLSLNNGSCQIALITRRSKYRPGLRYLSRGTDLQGHPANTCQTETILSVQQNNKQQYYSYVLLRGSMPFLWKQDPNLKFTPSVSINHDTRLNQQVFHKHYQSILFQYGKCTSINLVNKTGYQSELGKQFQQLHKTVNLPNSELIWFDFHIQCKKMKIQNLSKLLDQIDDNLLLYGYFHLQHWQKQQKNKFVQSRRQTGVFRLNCMDCLDRTNVVQSVISRKVLMKWLQKLNICDVSDKQVGFPKLPIEFQQVFRDQWTSNAHALSKLYAGTNAMKSDFTSKGKRTFSGMLADGKIGIQRYFLGNFYDNRKLDFINFSLGKVKPNEDQKQRVRHSPINSIYIFGILALTIPFIVHKSVDQFSDQETQTAGIKIAITAVSLFIYFKCTQLFKQLIVRKPIPIN